MADVVLFHHVQGLTAGVRRLADELRAGGHTVHTPDFFEGATFDSLDDGFAAVRARGEGACRRVGRRRGRRAARRRSSTPASRSA